jgi:hypothetical protein
MKTIVSALVALSLLAGIAGSANALDAQFFALNTSSSGSSRIGSPTDAFLAGPRRAIGPRGLRGCPPALRRVFIWPLGYLAIGALIHKRPAHRQHDFWGNPHTMLVHLAGSLTVWGLDVGRMQAVGANRVLDVELAHVDIGDHDKILANAWLRSG